MSPCGRVCGRTPLSQACCVGGPSLHSAALSKSLMAPPAAAGEYMRVDDVGIDGRTASLCGVFAVGETGGRGGLWKFCCWAERVSQSSFSGTKPIAPKCVAEWIA